MTEPVPAMTTEMTTDEEDVLRAMIAQIVTDDSGVLRLEPTLLTTVQGLGRSGSVDGVQLTSHHRIVDIEVNLATHADHQARSTTIDLQAKIIDRITAGGQVAGSVEISVLAIERPSR